MKHICIIACLFFFGCSSDPKTYEECVFDNMKGVSSDMAAKIVQKTCRAQFPPKHSIAFEDAVSMGAK